MSIDTSQDPNSRKCGLLSVGTFASVIAVAAITGSLVNRDLQQDNDYNINPEISARISSPAELIIQPITVTPLEQQEQADTFMLVINNQLTNRFLDEIGNFLPKINLDEAIDLTRTEMAIINESREEIEYQGSRIKTVIETTATVFSDHLARTHDNPNIIPLASESANLLAQFLIAEVHHDNVVTGFLDEIRDEIRDKIPAETFQLNQNEIDATIETTRKNMEQINDSTRMTTGSLTNKFILEKTLAEFLDALDTLNVFDQKTLNRIFMLGHGQLDVRAISDNYHKVALADIHGPSIDRELSHDITGKIQTGEFIMDSSSNAESRNAEHGKNEVNDHYYPTMAQE